MPDGDIIHPTLKRRFQNVYGQICEGHWDSSQLSFKALHPLKGQLKEYGNAPLIMGQAMVQTLESANSLAKQGKQVNSTNAIAQIIMRKTQQQVFHTLNYRSACASGCLRFLHIPLEAKYGLSIKRDDLRIR